MQGNLEWFENIEYEYGRYNKRLVAKKYNQFSKMFDVVGEARVGLTDIKYPEGVREALGFVVHGEHCKHHLMCKRFELKDAEGKVISEKCKKIFRLNIKLV